MKKFVFLSVAMVFIAFAANAQTSCAPIDGGLSLLLVAGAAGYGTKKIAEHRNKKETNKKS